MPNYPFGLAQVISDPAIEIDLDAIVANAVPLGWQFTEAKLEVIQATLGIEMGGL